MTVERPFLFQNLCALIVHEVLTAGELSSEVEFDGLLDAINLFIEKTKKHVASSTISESEALLGLNHLHAADQHIKSLLLAKKNADAYSCATDAECDTSNFNNCAMRICLFGISACHYYAQLVQS